MIYLAALCVAQGAVTVLVVVLAHRERRAAAEERGALLRRIQAPQLALVENQPPAPVAPPAVNEFNDDDYWESREALADRLAARELNGDE